MRDRYLVQAFQKCEGLGRDGEIERQRVTFHREGEGTVLFTESLEHSEEGPGSALRDLGEQRRKPGFGTVQW